METKKNNKALKPQKCATKSKKKFRIPRLNMQYKKTKKLKNVRNLKIGFDKLKFIEVLTKIQISFIIIMTLMLVFNKFNIFENLINTQISVFGDDNISDELDKIDLISSLDVHVIDNNNVDIIGTKDVQIERQTDTINNTVVSYVKGNSYEEIFRENYVVDNRAGVINGLFDFEKFESQDLTLTKPLNTEPKVLIFHTHGNEQYIDSKGIEEGVYLLGKTLEKELEEKYGINTIHLEKRYDQVDGKTQILGAYERVEPDVKAILNKYPSIEVTIDIHRDGLPGDMKQLVEIDGVDYAPLMFVNGLSTGIKNGKPEPLPELHNPYTQDNLAFSYIMKQNIDQKYKGLVKDIYLHAYRYSLHFKPKSMLLEVGAQNNTVEEAVNSVKKFAEVLADVLT